MKNNPLAILLCVRNSQRFLEPLLDSLYAQTYRDFDLWVHDDGSTDNTLDILRRYALRYRNLYLLPDARKDRGAKDSFFYLLEHVKADYYLFCDHDDVWLPEKIALTLEEMKRCEARHPGKAVVVNTDLCVTDAELRPRQPSFWAASGIDRELLSTFNYMAVYNAFTGCTMMINRAAKECSFPVSPQAVMHDRWIALKTISEGGVTSFVPQATILYRQHGDNVVGAQNVSWGYYRRRLTHLTATWKEMRQAWRMADSIRPYSFAKFLYYKVAYLLKRRMS